MTSSDPRVFEGLANGLKPEVNYTLRLDIIRPASVGQVFFYSKIISEGTKYLQ